MTSSSADITVHAHGLSREFGTRQAVVSLNLELKRGEILGLLGPNGAGKTTTMQMLTGNIAPSAGTVAVCGIDLLERPTAAKAHLGYLPEHPPLYRELTVREFLDLATRLHRVAKTKRRAAVTQAIERCGLTTVAGRLIGSLSKGYQQRVGIAQAIVHAPDVVILDEPTVGLDPNQIREIRSLIRELGHEHSVVLSTHILPEVESICDRVQILHHGNSVFNDTIAALRQFHAGRSILFGVRRPPPLSVFTEIPEVARARLVSPNLFHIDFAETGDPTEDLVRRAVGDDWGLFQLMPAQTSLEDVFVQLTRTEIA